MAFVKILNASNIQFELAYLGTSFKQIGNGSFSVPPGKIGVYKIESSASGKEVLGYDVVSVFERYPVPNFKAQDSYIYNFMFDGSKVTADSPKKIVF
jgi:hypothetical protein